MVRNVEGAAKRAATGPSGVPIRPSGERADERGIYRHGETSGDFRQRLLALPGTDARLALLFVLDLPQPSPTTSLAEPLLTADDVAVLLAVPRSSVYEYARRERDPLPALRIGRHVRFHRTHVEAWLAASLGAGAQAASRQSGCSRLREQDQRLVS